MEILVDSIKEKPYIGDRRVVKYKADNKRRVMSDDEIVMKEYVFKPNYYIEVQELRKCKNIDRYDYNCAYWKTIFSFSEDKWNEIIKDKDLYEYFTNSRKREKPRIVYKDIDDNTIELTY